MMSGDKSMEKKFGALSSSTNPQELSQTVTSALKIFGYIIGFIGTMKGVNFVMPEGEMEALSNAVVAIIAAYYALREAGDFIFGFGRRFITWLLGPKQ